ncbi:MAG: triose-phosphate isomerase [Candidatus Levybacteria bacterium]|nr:triose-phosphate isomerase [Candidatus Levybacteria bacterium]
MKKLFIVANWKSNKATFEAKNWLDEFKINDLEIENKEIVICPSFNLLSLVSSEIRNQKLEVKIGAQDISPFDEGAYTGEINGKQIEEFADYVIIGHSERRQYCKEDNETLNRKVVMAIKYNLLPIFCVQNQNTPVPPNVKIVAYEPVSAIGTGNPDTPDNAEQVARTIRAINKEIISVLYGGSVTSENINSFTKMPNIDGVLVGTSSLDSMEFLKIINNA